MEKPGPVAIVVVHGVLPHPRYDIQDQASAALAGALNQRDGAGPNDPWIVDVVNPRGIAAGAAKPAPTYSRVHRPSARGTAAGDRYYDVIEVYWSPLDKNLTTWPSIVSWLLRTIFMPLNTTARYVARPGKTAFDVGYVAIALLGVFGGVAAAAYFAVSALGRLVAHLGGKSDGAAALFAVIGDPEKLAALLPWQAFLVLAMMALGAYGVAQSVRAASSIWTQRGVLTIVPIQFWSRIAVTLGLLVLGLALLVSGALVKVGVTPMGPDARLFVLAALAFEGASTLLQSFVVNFFGDVQIYTTHDENSSFFAAREAILELATNVLREATSSTAARGTAPYTAVHLLAHSLGSTIALDALIRLYQLREQHGYDPRDFRRIRSFVTFGSALEKTKYFFDAHNPSPSLAYEYWRNDQYGVLFTRDDAVLDHPAGNDVGIFWANYWYWTDPVANAIDSYRSVLLPGDSVGAATAIRGRVKAEATRAGITAAPLRRVAHNEPPSDRRLYDGFRPWHPMVHGDYLGDRWLWFSDDPLKEGAHLGVLDIVARRPGTATVEPPPVRFAAGQEWRARIDAGERGDARWYRDGV